MLRTKAAARAVLIVALALAALPGLHPDGRLHAAGEPGIAALSADLEGWAHNPDCALCRLTSQVRTALHDPSHRSLQAAPSASLRFQGAGEIARSAPGARGPHARAPPSV